MIELIKENLTYSEYTFENFHLPGRGIPKPWDRTYGTDLSKLDSIEWSAYDKLASDNEGATEEMQWYFRNNQLVAFTRTHEAYPHLRQRIGELGIPSVDGGAVLYTAAEATGAVDYEEQRRAATAILRELMRYIQNGNDFFEGWFWHALIITNDPNNIHWRKAMSPYGKPAMEEFYAFYSPQPRKLPVIPYSHNIYSTWVYVDPLQDIHLIRDSLYVETIQGFEGSRSYSAHLSAWRLHYIDRYANASVRINAREAYEGSQSLEVSVTTKYGKGANVSVSPAFPVGSWEDIEAVSIAIKREDPTLGAALIIPDGQDLRLSYTVRLPVSKVGEWEYFVIPLSDFVTLAPDGEYVGIQDRSTLSPWDIHVVFYPTEEGPLDTKVYIDSLGVVRRR